MTWWETPAARALGVRYPLLQAPMSGVTTPELVAAVSDAGALGSLGAAWMPPDDLRAAIRAVRALTDASYMVNLFAWPRPDPAPDAHPSLEAQLAIVVDERVPVLGFTFGIPDFAEVKAAGAAIVGTATTVGEARALEAAGVDVVVAQGWEAGGHRGTFERSPSEVDAGVFALVPQVVDAVSVPVLAAGAIMDGRGIAAALALGAHGASVGTAFMTATEAATPPVYRRLLAKTPVEGTRVSRVFSGREARLVRTDAVEELVGSGSAPSPYPLQLEATRPTHRAGLAEDDATRLFALAGQGAALVRELPAAELVAALVGETDEAVRRLAGTSRSLA
jgi:nitronate monooxygenase